MRLQLPLFILLLVWIPATLVTIASALVAIKPIEKNQIMPPSQYQMYASYPKVLAEMDYNLTFEDAIPELIRQYLVRHQSPMQESYQALVASARKNDIDPLLMVAIAQCESNLGKKMPEGCNNPFGWGIHSAGTLCFASWEEGYEKVSQGLKAKYVAQGLKSVEDIMTKYNYASASQREGSWAKCVNHFMEKLQYLE